MSEPYRVGPGKPPLENRFTGANAAYFAKRSWLDRPAKMETLPARARKQVEQLPFEREAQKLWRQVDKLRRLISREDDPQKLANLTVAHSRLFSSWQVLTGTERPGTRRSNKPRPPVLAQNPVLTLVTPQDIVSDRIFVESNIPI